MNRTSSIAGSLLPVLLLLAAVLLRLPYLMNAEHLLDSDVAFNALAVRHLFQGEVFFLYYPGQDYQGITEGVLGILLTKLLGWSAFAYIGSAFLAYLAYVVVLYGLARILFDGRTAVLAGWLAVVMPVPMLRYSLFARGGHVEVLLAGVLLLLFTVRFERSRRPIWLALIGFTAGFAYYTYKLSVVVIAPVFVHLGLQALNTLFAPDATGSSLALRFHSFRQRHALSLLLGLVFLFVGLLPALTAIWLAPPEVSKPPVQQVEQGPWRENARRLFSQTLPSLLGCDTQEADRRSWPGHARNMLIVSVLGAALIGTLWTVFRRDTRRMLLRERGGLSPESLLLLALAAVPAAYISTRYIVDPTSSRYLIPLYVVLPLLIGSVTVKWAGAFRRPVPQAVAAWLPVVLLAGVYLHDTVQFYRSTGLLASRGCAIRQPAYAPRDVLQHLRHEGISGAYGTYWLAYHLTFLADEKVLVAPYKGIDQRKPPDYYRLLRGYRNPAYLFLATDLVQRQEFVQAMESQGIRLKARFFPGFKGGIYVFTAAKGTLPHL